MSNNFSLGPKLETLATALEDSYFAYRRIHHINTVHLPARDEVYEITRRLFALIFPGFFGRQDLTSKNIHQYLTTEMDGISQQMYQLIYQCFRCRSKNDPASDHKMASQATERFFGELAHTRELMANDVLASYKGDPAAQDTDEVIFSYPATIAIGTYRLAHTIWKMAVPLMPRIMTEHAHSQTGIDIHPGAQIGKGFFIDHGTGVVIGETAIIGDNCKLYQGVTLGAVSLPYDETGLIKRNYKRHPTLEDDVVVYSNATILGNVTIGKGSTVGGGVFLTQSVPPGCTVSTRPAELRYRNRCVVLGGGRVFDYWI